MSNKNVMGGGTNLLLRRRMLMGTREDKPKANEIWYYAPEKVTLYMVSGVVSHEFANGKGVLVTATNRMNTWFRNVSGITRLIIGDNYTQTTNNTLRGMGSLEELVFPDTLTSLAYQTIMDMPNLQMVKLSSSLMSINSCFKNCPNLSIISELPPTLTSITTAFLSGKYSHLIFRGTTPPTIEGSCFTWDKAAPLYVPAEAVDAYKEAWPTYAERIQAIPDNL